MYNPTGSDNNREFIEIYGINDLAGWIIGDSSSNDSLELLFDGSSFESEYVLIVEEGFNYSNINCSVYSVGTTIGDNLNNDGDKIFLYNDEAVLIDSVEYEDTYADDNGKSLEFINGSWLESSSIGGSPGYVNGGGGDSDALLFQDLSIEQYLNDPVYLGLSYDSLFKIKNINYELGKVYDVNVVFNITKDALLVYEGSFLLEEINQYKTAGTGLFDVQDAGEFLICGFIQSSSANDTNIDNNVICFNVTSIDPSTIPCNISLNLSLERQVFENGEKVEFYNLLNNETFSYLIEYWIEDLFGDIRKSRYNTSNTNKKSWTPNIDEKDEGFLLKSRIAYVACNDENINDNYDEKLFIVRNNGFSLVTSEDSEGNPNSSIVIDNIYLGSDNKTKFGQTFRVKLDIHKGNDTKDSVKVWVENDDGNRISAQTTSMLLYSTYTDYILAVPVQMKPNCNEEFDDGIYHLIVEGLDIRQQQDFYVEGIDTSMCIELNDCECDDEDDSSSGVDYSFNSMPLAVDVGNDFLVSVKIENNDDESHEFQVYGYVYRGSKAYTEREINMKKVYVPRKSDVIIELNNLIEEAEAGDYKYKVKIRKDEQKTQKELTSNIVVLGRPHIEKFYTRSTKPTDEINLYANIVGGDKVILETFHESIEKEVDEDLKFPVKVFNGRNVFFLKLIKNNKVVDFKDLVIEVENGMVYSLDEAVEVYSDDILDNFDSPLESGKDVIVYQSSSRKAFNLVPYFTMFSCILICVVVVVWKF
ncbi:lamin tail domain-containing protein [Candidatus Woesearchaeota archaeon]|nr:lamin tail domain-containing protein [Candidatus Woesearchaeota archaeon]